MTGNQTVIKAKGHKWGKWTITKKPTTTKTGLKPRVCLNEDDHKETQVIPALGKLTSLPATMTAKGKTPLVIKWKKVSAADGYDI